MTGNGNVTPKRRGAIVVSMLATLGLLAAPGCGMCDIMNCNTFPFLVVIDDTADEVVQTAIDDALALLQAQLGGSADEMHDDGEMQDDDEMHDDGEMHDE